LIKLEECEDLEIPEDCDISQEKDIDNASGPLIQGFHYRLIFIIMLIHENAIQERCIKLTIL
jgi:hypothetical protein